MALESRCNTLGVWLLLIAFRLINMCIIYLIMSFSLKHTYETFAYSVCLILDCLGMVVVQHMNAT